MVLKNYILNIIILVTTTICIAQNPIEKEGWTLTFNDEFNDTVLDKSKWQDFFYWGGRNYDKDIVYYGPDQFEFSDSSLLIKAEKKELSPGIPYVSGLLDGNKSFKQRYGFFEIRCKNPKGTGFWPALSGQGRRLMFITRLSLFPIIFTLFFFLSFPRALSSLFFWKRHRSLPRKGGLF